MNDFDIFTGIFKYEYPISLLSCCMTIIENVFEDIYKVCQSRCSSKEHLQQIYSKLVKQTSAWSYDLYEKEVLNCISAHPYFQDVVERSFVTWVKSYYKKTKKKIQVNSLSTRFFTQKLIEVSSSISYIHDTRYFSLSNIERKDLCMEIIRNVFHKCDEFIIVYEDDDNSFINDMDDIMPTDSISNVCLDDQENTTSFPPDLNTVPAAMNGGIVGS